MENEERHIEDQELEVSNVEMSNVEMSVGNERSMGNLGGQPEKGILGRGLENSDINSSF